MKQHTGHPVKDQVPMRSLLAVGRSYTREPKGGKKQPRLLDLNPEDRASLHSDTRDAPVSVAESIVACGNDTNDAVRVSDSTDAFVSSKKQQVASVNIIGKPTFVSKKRPAVVFEQVKKSNKREKTTPDSDVILTKKNRAQQKTKSKGSQKWIENELEDTKKKPSKALLNQFDYYVREAMPDFLEPVDDPVTGLRSNKSLSNAITDNSWLTGDMIDECCQFMILEKKKQDKFFSIPPNYAITVANEDRSSLIIKHLEQFQAHTKSIFLMPLKTNVFGDHWILGVVSFEKKKMLLLNSLLSEPESYWSHFNYMISVVKINEKLQKREFDLSEWEFIDCLDIAQQPNTFDCGVFVTFFVKQILDQKSLIECNHVEEQKPVKNMFKIDYRPNRGIGKLPKKSLNLSEFDEILKEKFVFNIVYANF